MRITPAQLHMYGEIQYNFDTDVPEGETLSNGIDYHGPPPCELKYAGVERGDD